VISNNITFVIQCKLLVCEQSNSRHDSLQTYITIGRCFRLRMRTLNPLVRC